MRRPVSRVDPTSTAVDCAGFRPPTQVLVFTGPCGWRALCSGGSCPACNGMEPLGVGRERTQAMFHFQNKEAKAVVQENMTLEQVRQSMIELMKAENTNHHRMGQLYNYVVKNKLAQNAGYKD